MFERFTKKARQALIAAQTSAQELGHPLLGSEHLLLAIVRLGKGEAYEILRDRIGDPTALRPKVMEALRRAS